MTLVIHLTHALANLFLSSQVAHWIGQSFPIVRLGLSLFFPRADDKTYGKLKEGFGHGEWMSLKLYN